jgi:hypothetical protein
MPTITYHERAGLRLEERLSDYLEERHKILSVSGQTKSGKTVLLKNRVANGIWVQGGNVKSDSDVWDQVCDILDLATELETTDAQEETAEHSTQTSGSAQPFGIGVKAARTASEGFSESRGSSRRQFRSTREAATRALGTLAHTLVIDDFHYIDPAVQLKIVRTLKPMVFDGLAVIFASVPHRAYDAVRVENEMTGRVEQLPIPLWQPGELSQIAVDGFAALNVSDPDNVDRVLARQAFGSPHLMQDFCLQLCKAQGIRDSTSGKTSVVALDPWKPFFNARATATAKAAYDLLARGPRQRKDRKSRTRVDGVVTDIYGAVLAAIAHTGPKTSITYEELRTSLRQVLSDEPPQRNEVTRILEEMTRIAKEKIEGEPVVDYDSEIAVLYISDPFFAYFLKWGFIDSFLRRPSPTS